MDPYIGEIRMFGGNFAPAHWAYCHGSLLAISGNSALFSLLGTNFGGDGRTTFALPDMRGRVPVHQGSGPGLTTRYIGQMYGVENVVLNATEIPNHSHPMQASTGGANNSDPGDRVMATGGSNDKLYMTPTGSETINDFADAAVQTTGNNQSHTNLMPTLCVNFIIAMAGIYPPRN